MQRALRPTIAAGALALGLLGGTAGTAQALAQTGTPSTSNAVASNAKKARVVVVGAYNYSRCNELGRQKLREGAYHYSCTNEGGPYNWVLRAYYD